MTPNQRFATKAYASIGIQTRGAERDQYELALLMFEAVIENTAAARGAIEDGQTAAKAQFLHKAVRILQDGLRTSLDLENGGELANNLASLYDYCVLRLTQANAENDAAATAEVIDLIRPIADAWKQMREQPPVAPSALPTAAAAATPGDPTPPTKTAFSAGNLYGSRLGGTLLVGA
ncbi:MAG: flagellar export chaperone FliS [Serpentinimonas sp.]|jgi:flagellar protein FliS|nr:flagellar export chaperone FliS [Serpentinimonas sp.]